MTTYGFSDFFSTPFLSDVRETPILSNIERESDMVLHRSSPGYEVTESDDNFQLSMYIPGLNISDIHVTLEHGGRVLKVNGGRKIKQILADETITCSETKFEKRFILDHTIDTMNVTASLVDNTLQVCAPKMKWAKNHIRKIPIAEGPCHGLLTEDGEHDAE